MTAEDLKSCGIIIDGADETTVLTVESALEYVKANTNLEFELTDIASIAALPSCVKLFVVKYNEIMSKDSGVTSESLGGMSQSFETGDKNTLFYNLLCGLCGQYVVSQFKCAPRIGRYVYGR